MAYKELPSIPEYWAFPEVVGQTGIPAGILERMVTGQDVRVYLFAEGGIWFESYPLAEAFRGAPDGVFLSADSPVGFLDTTVRPSAIPFGGDESDALECRGFFEVREIWGYRGALDGEEVGALLQPYDGRFDVIGNVSGSVKKALLDAVERLGFDTNVRIECKRLYFHWQDINKAVARLNSTRSVADGKPVDAPTVASDEPMLKKSTVASIDKTLKALCAYRSLKAKGRNPSANNLQDETERLFHRRVGKDVCLKVAKAVNEVLADFKDKDKDSGLLF